MTWFGWASIALQFLLMIGLAKGVNDDCKTGNLVGILVCGLVIVGILIVGTGHIHGSHPVAGGAWS